MRLQADETCCASFYIITMVNQVNAFFAVAGAPSPPIKKNIESSNKRGGDGGGVTMQQGYSLVVMATL